MKPGQKTDDEMLSNGKYFIDILNWNKCLTEVPNLNVGMFQKKATRNGTDLFHYWETKFDYVDGIVFVADWTLKVAFIFQLLNMMN